MLLRLGFIGDEYKTARKLLMKGIPGNGSKRHVEYVAGEGDGDDGKGAVPEEGAAEGAAQETDEAEAPTTDTTISDDLTEAAG
jgi:hypothetical protein